MNTDLITIIASIVATPLATLFGFLVKLTMEQITLTRLKARNAKSDKIELYVAIGVKAASQGYKAGRLKAEERRGYAMNATKVLCDKDKLDVSMDALDILTESTVWDTPSKPTAPQIPTATATPILTSLPDPSSDELPIGEPK
jgi:hypothetical protein